MNDQWQMFIITCTTRVRGEVLVEHHCEPWTPLSRRPRALPSDGAGPLPAAALPPLMLTSISICLWITQSHPTSHVPAFILEFLPTHLERKKPSAHVTAFTNLSTTSVTATMGSSSLHLSRNSNSLWPLSTSRVWSLPILLESLQFIGLPSVLDHPQPLLPSSLVTCCLSAWKSQHAFHFGGACCPPGHSLFQSPLLDSPSRERYLKLTSHRLLPPSL